MSRARRAARTPARVAGWALLALVWMACAGSRPRGVGELTNPRLGPEYSQWLVGAVARMASPREIEAYLGLSDDPAAAQFIERFWERRDPEPEEPGNPPRDAFLARSAEADRRFSEAGYLGRRTDRGTIFILYGEPRESRFAIGEFEEEPAIEEWLYGAAAAVGLDGKRPQAIYRFAKLGDLTTFYSARGRRPSPDPGGP